MRGCIRRPLDVQGFPVLARGQFREELHINTEHGAAEAYFSGIEGYERMLGGGLIQMVASVNYGHSALEERLIGACDGY